MTDTLDALVARLRGWVNIRDLPTMREAADAIAALHSENATLRTELDDVKSHNQTLQDLLVIAEERDEL